MEEQAESRLEVKLARKPDILDGFYPLVLGGVELAFAEPVRSLGI